MPFELKNRAIRQARFARIKEPHIKKLTSFVEKMRAEQDYINRNIPYFDPCDGGTNATLLYLLESPGDKAVLSGFISRDNPDETARNFLKLTANIPRKHTVMWNIVPWHVGRGRISSKDFVAGLSQLTKLLRLLPKLRIVVLIGKKAQRAGEKILRSRPNIRVINTHHPSPMFINRNQQLNYHKIETDLLGVANFLKPSRMNK